MKKLLLLFHFIFIGNGVFAQVLNADQQSFFAKQEDSLKRLQHLVFHSKSDSLKSAYNKLFFQLWDEVLSNQLSFEYPFDSLVEVGRLTSPDKRFRIVNWNIAKNDGTHTYFGFIQSHNPETKQLEVFKLLDHSSGIKNPETHTGSNEKWFGMLYYAIIPGKEYYTLLGWDGNDKLTQRKFIDVLYFKKDGDPMFGKDIFKMPQKNPRRVMFEYSSEIVMSLKYDDVKKRIVFDHLAPRDPLLEGQYQFYGPDFSFDAFNYSKGKWKYEADVDAKNKKNKNDNVIHKDNKEKPIYTPK